MNIDRPTPDTDALISVGLENADRECVPAEFGRKLERERDEAIRQLENIKASSIHSCHDQCRKPMCVLRRERDKWEETARLYCQNSDYHREMREKAERERDEAREALRELWQTADAYIPQIDEEQTTKWHNAMFGNSKNG
jgi:hypothetical protein